LRDDSQEPIEQIVVVAHKSERRLRDIAANVMVLAREDTRADLSSNLADRYTPGIDPEAAAIRFGADICGSAVR